MKWILILLIFSGKFIYAQSQDPIQYSSVKVDIANFIDDFPALLISYEHPIGKNFYLTHEGGPILSLDPSEGEKAGGFKLKEELRIFLENWNTTNLYLGLAARYSHENLFKDVLFGYECNGQWNCAYFQNSYGKFQKRMIAFDLRMGFRHHISKFFIEYDLGYGYGKDTIHSPQLNNDENFSRITEHPFNIFLENWKALVSARFNIGFKFRYQKN